MDIVIEEDVIVKKNGNTPRKPEKADPSQLEALKASILSESGIQANKAAFIREAIAEGRYEIDCFNIAERMLADI